MIDQKISPVALEYVEHPGPLASVQGVVNGTGYIRSPESVIDEYLEGIFESIPLFGPYLYECQSN